MFSCKVKISTIILTICMIGFLKPPFTSSIPILDTSFNSFRVIGFIVIVVHCLSKKVTISMFTKGMICYELIYVLITIYRNGNLSQSVIVAATVIGELILFEIAIKKGQKNFADFLNLICRILSVYVILNLISIWLLPQGFDLTENKSPIYFLGIHNRFIFWMLPLISFSCLSAYLKRGKLSYKQYIIHFICLFTLLGRNAVGGALGLLLFYIFWILIQKRKAVWADYRLYLIVYITFWLALTFSDSLVSLTNITLLNNKEGSLAARLNLWTKGINYLATDLNHLLLGYGLEIDNVIKVKFWYSHLHNNLLNVAYQTGIIGVVTYCIPFVSLIRPFLEFKYDNSARIVSFTLLIFFMILLVDTYDIYGHFYVFGVIGSNFKFISSQNGNKS